MIKANQGKLHFSAAVTGIMLVFVIAVSVTGVGCGKGQLLGGKGGGGGAPAVPPAPCVNNMAKAARLSVDVKKSLIDMPDFFSDEAVVDFADDKKDGDSPKPNTDKKD